MNRIQPRADADPDPGMLDLVEEITDRLQAGERVNLQAYCDAHPRYADELQKLLPTLRAMGEVERMPGRAPDGPAAPESTPRELGDFRLSREIGRGGMGVVYEAEQLSLGRRVALKVLPFASVLDPRQLKRFQNEAHAAAALHHANIVPVFGTGCQRGVHYYAMQYIEGPTLADVIRDIRHRERKDATRDSTEEAQRLEFTHSLTSIKFAPQSPHIDATTALPSAPQTTHQSGAASPVTAETTRGGQAAVSTHHSSKSQSYCRGVAELGIQVADALHHAHEEGIIHRDIKPSNLMLDEGGKIWVTDFGLARVESNPGLTMTGDLIGTLRYMSPEQAMAKRVVIDERTDIYSLGASLYELLTLEPAYSGNDRQELLRQIAFEEPRLPRRINRSIPVELQIIVLKAMEKNAVNRYQTARLVADDLRRFLENQPILAKAPSVAQRLRKWSQRHKSLVASAAAMLLLAVVGLAVASATLARQRNLALEEKAEAERQLRVANSLRLAAHAQSILDEHPVQSLLLGVESIESVKRRNEPIPPFAEQSLRDSLASVGGRPFLPGGFALSANHRWLANKQDDEVRVIDLATPWNQEIVMSGDAGTWIAAISSDRQWLVTTERKREGPREIRLWNLHSNDPQTIIHSDEGLIWSTRISPDNRWLAVGIYGQPLSSGERDITIRLWDLTAHDIPGSVKVLRRVTAQALEFSPDNHWLASGTMDRTARLWDLTSDDPTANSVDLHVGEQEESVWSLRFSPDGHWLAAGTQAKSKQCAARMWKLTSKDPESSVLVFDGHHIEIEAVAFSPDGRWFVTADMDSTAKLWDLHADVPNSAPVILRGHQHSILRAKFSPDSRWLVTCSHDRTARIWSLTAKDPAATSVVLRGHEASVAAWVIFTRDSQWMITRDADRATRLWNIATLAQGLPADSGGNQELATDPIVIGGPYNFRRHLGFLEDSSRFVSPGENNSVRLWSLTEENSVTAPLVFSGGSSRVVAAVSSDSRWLAMGARDGMVRLWDLERKAPAANTIKLSGHNDAVWNIRFSPDGRWLATSSRDRSTRVWNLTSDDMDSAPTVLQGPATPRGVLQFSPDGHWLAMSSADTNEFAVRLWDARADSLDTRPRILRGHQAPIRRATFSPESRWLAAGSDDRAVWLWDLSAADPSKEPFVLRGHQSPIENLRFSPDRRWLASASWERDGPDFTGDATVRLWDLSAEHFASKSFILPQQLLLGTEPFAPNRSQLVTVGQDASVRLWDLTTADPSADSLVLRGHSVLPQSVAFSPDGRWLASSGGFAQNKTEPYLRLWDLASPHPEGSAILLRSSEPPQQLAFSPDSRRLAGQGYDGTVRIWTLRMDALLAMARRTAGRQLSSEERKKFFLEGRMAP